MPAVLLPPRLPARLLRRSLLALLVLGLLLQAQAGVLRQLLGAAHWHRPAAVQAAADDGWLDRLQAWRRDLLARSPLIAGHGRQAVHDERDGHHHAAASPAAATHGHHHDGAARHHHAPQDTSVVTAERAAGDADPLSDSQVGSLLQPLALDAGWRDVRPSQAPTTWPGSRTPQWQDAARRLPERPPRA
jgi:hypothetical protein